MPDLRRVQHLLVVKPSSLGDVVHTLPAVHALKKAYPHLQISWVVNPEWSPLLEGNADLHRVLLFPRGKFRGLRGLPRLARWVSSLNWAQPDIALDFQGLFRSALLCRLGHARKIYCLGNAEWPVRLLAHKVVPIDPYEHAVDRYLRMVTALGVEIDRPIEFPLPEGNSPADIAPGFVLLHPFSRGQNKSMTVASVERLCAMLAPERVVLVGRSQSAISPSPNVINLLNKTSLPELVWLCRRAGYICSVDSGPMHIAAAVTDRLLGIHTWTDPRKVGPYPGTAWVWKAGRILRRADVTSELAGVTQMFRLNDLEAVAQHILAQLAALRSR